MKQVNRWRPDTCGCKIEFEWDDSLPEDDRVNTFRRLMVICPAHEKLLDHNKIYGEVVAENNRKNILLGEIIGNVTSVTEDFIQDGTVVTWLKDGRDYRWAYTPDRILKVNLVGFSAPEKSAVRAIADSLFPGKVKVL